MEIRKKEEKPRIRPAEVTRLVCDGCVGLESLAVCEALPECYDDDREFIWIKVEAPSTR